MTLMIISHNEMTITLCNGSPREIWSLEIDDVSLLQKHLLHFQTFA